MVTLSTFHILGRTNTYFHPEKMFPIFSSSIYNTVRLEGGRSGSGMSPRHKRICFQTPPQAFLVMLDQSCGLLCASISILYCRANSMTLHQKGQSCGFLIQPSWKKQHIVLLTLWGYFWTLQAGKREMKALSELCFLLLEQK